MLDKNNFNRRDFLKISGFASIPFLTGRCNSNLLTKRKKHQHPNIIYILPDQWRRHALGLWGKPEYKNCLNTKPDPVITPNIDRLADGGVVLSQAISNHSLCSPHRGMLWSGMYPEQNGIHHNCYASYKFTRDDHLKDSATCLTDVLHNSGYNTAYFGKTHWTQPKPGYDKNGNWTGKTEKSENGGYFIPSRKDHQYDTYIPPGEARHSIEHIMQTVNNNHNYPNCYYGDDGKLVKDRIFGPRNEANHIIDYLEGKSKDRDPSKPFCIIWSPNPPHQPYSDIDDTNEKSYKKYYKDKSVNQLLVRENVTSDKANDNVKYYFSSITGIDKQIGRVMNTLKKHNLEENTIVVFSSDHGEMMGSHDKMHKNNEYEEAMGIPFIVRYPKRLKHHTDDMILSTPDIMPTLLGLAGLNKQIPEEVDGTDYSELLINPDSKKIKRPKSALYLKNNTPTRGVRTDRYTMTITRDTKNKYKNPVLYDNKKDPYQMTNLDFSQIPEEDLTFLRKEFGKRLAIANDKWYKEKLYSDFIIYPD